MTGVENQKYFRKKISIESEAIVVLVTDDVDLQSFLKIEVAEQ